MTHEPAELPAPPPPERRTPSAPPSDPEPSDVWPDEPTDELAVDEWASEADDPDPGWEEPDIDTSADEPAWSDDEAPSSGVELADEPDRELPTQDDPWDSEGPLPAPQEQP